MENSQRHQGVIYSLKIVALLNILFHNYQYTKYALLPLPTAVTLMVAYAFKQVRKVFFIALVGIFMSWFAS